MLQKICRVLVDAAPQFDARHAQRAMRVLRRAGVRECACAAQKKGSAPIDAITIFVRAAVKQ